MPRSARIVIPDEPAVYHVMFRTALGGYPSEDVKKDFLVNLIRCFSKVYFTEIFAFSVMGNHFHLLLRMFPKKSASEINCLAYIDLNPIRAGLVKRPEDYRWNSIGYHERICGGLEQIYHM